MARGDHIYVWRKVLLYSHHGIDLGDGTVIHYTGEPGRKSDAAIQNTTMVEFALGEEFKIRKYRSCDDAETTIERAKSRLRG